MEDHWRRSPAFRTSPLCCSSIRSRRTEKTKRVLHEDLVALPLTSPLHSFKIPFLEREAAGEPRRNHSGLPVLSARSLRSSKLLHPSHHSPSTSPPAPTDFSSFSQLCIFLFTTANTLLSCCIQNVKKTQLFLYSAAKQSKEANKQQKKPHQPTWRSAKASGTRTLS